MPKPNDQFAHRDEAQKPQSGKSENPAVDGLRDADGKAMKGVADRNRQAVKGSVGDFLAWRDGDTLDKARVRLLQHKQSEMGIVDEEKGIVHTAKGLLPLIPEGCSYETAKQLSKIVAKSEPELRDKLQELYGSGYFNHLQSPASIEAPQPKALASARELDVRKPGDGVIHTVSDQEFESARVRFWNESGVEISQQGGRYEYHLRGHKETLCTSDRTSQGLEAAHRSIESQRLAKIAELKLAYHATFSSNEETAGKQSVYDAATNSWKEGVEDVHCRAPRLFELIGIEAALRASQPSAQGIKFYMMTNQLFRNITEMADCHAIPSGGSDKTARVGSPAVFINANETLKYPPTESVAGNWAQAADWTGTSIESSIVHELVHHSQSVMNWDGVSVKTFGMTEAARMGWVSVMPVTRDTNKWLLEDKSGNFWKHEHAVGSAWVRLKTNGQPLDANGKPCDYARVHRISNEEMVKIAKVKPATNYNDTPKEMFAEAMTKFRDGFRSDLFKNNRALYDIVKAADQAEINFLYPVDKSMRPTKIRAADGRIVANTPAENAGVEKLEK